MPFFESEEGRGNECAFNGILRRKGDEEPE